MGAEVLLAAVLAWVATAALHSTAWLGGALACSALLKKIVRHRIQLALARERLYKLAIFGGLATATLALVTGRATPIDVPSARAVGAPSFPRALQRRPAPAELAPTEPGFALQEPAPESPWKRIPWIELAGGFWLAGVAGGGLLWLRDHRRLSRRLRGRTRLRAGPAAELFARGLSATPSRRIVLSRAPSLTAPITRGILRTEVCIPPRAERDLLDEEIEAMLAHELAHARRRDPLLLACCRAIEVVLFFQPLFPLARRRLVEEIEILCDDRAAKSTGDPAALASCLAEVATWIVAGSPEARAIAMAAGRSRLEQRVGLLLDRGPRSSDKSPLFAPVAFALVASAIPLPAFAMRAASGEPWRVEADVLPAGFAPAAFVPTIESVERSAAPAKTEPSPSRDELLAEWAQIRADLGALEAESTSLANDSALAGSPPEFGTRLLAVRGRLEALRSLESEIEEILAEETSAER